MNWGWKDSTFCQAMSTQTSATTGKEQGSIASPGGGDETSAPATSAEELRSCPPNGSKDVSRTRIKNLHGKQELMELRGADYCVCKSNPSASFRSTFQDDCTVPIRAFGHLVRTPHQAVPGPLCAGIAPTAAGCAGGQGPWPSCGGIGEFADRYCGRRRDRWVVPP